MCAWGMRHGDAMNSNVEQCTGTLSVTIGGRADQVTGEVRRMRGPLLGQRCFRQAGTIGG